MVAGGQQPLGSGGWAGGGRVARPPPLTRSPLLCGLHRGALARAFARLTVAFEKGALPSAQASQKPARPTGSSKMAPIRGRYSRWRAVRRARAESRLVERMGCATLSFDAGADCRCSTYERGLPS